MFKAFATEVTAPPVVDAAGRSLTLKGGKAQGAGAVRAGDLYLVGGTGEGAAQDGGVTVLSGGAGEVRGGHVIIAPGPGAAGGAEDGNVNFNSQAASSQGMRRGFFYGNCNVAPGGNPTSGVFVWFEGGAGKARGTSGTVTTWAPSDPHCQKCGRDCALEWTNDDAGWDLAVCVWCLTEALGGAGIIRKSQK